MYNFEKLKEGLEREAPCSSMDVLLSVITGEREDIEDYKDISLETVKDILKKLPYLSEQIMNLQESIHNVGYEISRIGGRKRLL